MCLVTFKAVTIVLWSGAAGIVGRMLQSAVPGFMYTTGTPQQLGVVPWCYSGVFECAVLVVATPSFPAFVI